MTILAASLPERLQPYAKSVVAILGTIVAILAVVASDQTWLPIVLQIATAAGVYQTPNLKPLPVEPDPPAVPSEQWENDGSEGQPED